MRNICDSGSTDAAPKMTNMQTKLSKKIVGEIWMIGDEE